jgi:hypothetical protein
VLCLDNYSPRENFSYSEDPISVDDAWEQALTLCPELARKYEALERKNEE